MRVLLAFLLNTLFNFVIGLLVAKFLGPEQFGRFALALAVGMVVQTAVFDWIRLTAVRFYSERSRQERPELRATLDVGFAVLAVGLAALTMTLMLSGITFAMPNALMGLAVAAAVANGLFDYHSALIRARFLDGIYGKLILTKNILALTLTAGGAFIFNSAIVALVGACLAMAGSMLFARKQLSDRDARPDLAHRGLAREFGRYAMPIVAANLLYLIIPLVNRGLVTGWYGYAETGQYSLAFDIGTRVAAAIGSALDVLLFQIAVRADEHHGVESGREQVAQNMGLVAAIMLPATVGLWLVLPSLEQLIVPQEFRGPFAHYLSLLLPGLFCFGLIQFAINPVFQIGKRTMPLIAAAALGCIANAGLIWFLPHGNDASNLAIAQTGAMAVSLLALLVFAGFYGARWPRARDLLLTALGAALMAGLLYPTRAWQPSVLTLLFQMLAGGAIYGAIVMAFDVAGLRGFALVAAKKFGLIAR